MATSKHSNYQLWGGRFSEQPSEALQALNISLPYDSRLYADDLDASKAYAEALQRAGYLNTAEADKLVKSLELIRYDWIERTIKFLPSDEDVHTVNERLLVEITGELGQRLHTGRSRNDQVVTDMKLWLRRGIRETLGRLNGVIEAAVKQAELHLGVLMPGYTHMQRAQPVQFSHWLLSHVFALREDCLRLAELRVRANVLPLGSGALAGNPLGIDRLWLAERLGFSGVTANSMHAVGDRDFVVDFIYCCSLVSLHLSRMAEDLIIYSTKEFDFIRLHDSFSSGSSLMPQKRNPDSLELIRGISGVISSNLTGIMMTIKGTPSTYNKDLQFDKEYCFQSFDKLAQVLDIARGVIQTMQVQRDTMEAALSPDMLATDWAYYLVKKGIPFRQAHHFIGRVVALAEQRGVGITEVPLGELQQICPAFGSDIASVADYAYNVQQYDVIGGTSTGSIEEQLRLLKNFVKDLRKQS
ncbi:argininosuccinate lyase [Drosophila guanche]|uniref:Blast:Argininosuccinate lyase n=1 Tax=Drosophila guanche TaxID=7266 RepID=A0A3B0K101_DROGU|nr:argininosuccinate lyase [Drosophila guanche]SPP81520.1 blast:Argininosuccinate lyase [Drosophila guanche]